MHKLKMFEVCACCVQQNFFLVIIKGFLESLELEKFGHENFSE